MLGPPAVVRQLAVEDVARLGLRRPPVVGLDVPGEVREELQLVRLLGRRVVLEVLAVVRRVKDRLEVRRDVMRPERVQRRRSQGPL